MNFNHNLPRHTALASITATYSDSEGELDSDVEKESDEKNSDVDKRSDLDKHSDIDKHSDVDKNSDIDKHSDVDKHSDAGRHSDSDKLSDIDKNSDVEKSPDSDKNSDFEKNSDMESSPYGDKHSDIENSSDMDKNSDADKNSDIGKYFAIERNSDLTKNVDSSKNSDIEMNRRDLEATNSDDSPMSSSYTEEKFYEYKYPLRERSQMSKLVSYSEDKEGGDEVSDSDQSRSSDYDMQDESNGSPNISIQNPPLSPRSFHQSLKSLKKGEIKLPPEPTGRCSNSLQEKVSELYEKKKLGKDLNAMLQHKKNFRNPSIYEKLIHYCEIDERGTNYPPEIYDPHAWGPESFYEELAKRQKEEMDKREKEKKERTKVEFISGTAKKPSGESLPGVLRVPENIEFRKKQSRAWKKSGKRKSKWDVGITQLPSSTLKPATLITPNVLPVATGTKPTVISAFGTITKKPKQ